MDGGAPQEKKKKISLPTSFYLRLANINIKHLKSIHFTFSFDSFYILRASLVAQKLKHMPAMQETQV